MVLNVVYAQGSHNWSESKQDLHKNQDQKEYDPFPLKSFEQGFYQSHTFDLTLGNGVPNIVKSIELFRSWVLFGKGWHVSHFYFVLGSKSQHGLDPCEKQIL